MLLVGLLFMVNAVALGGEDELQREIREFHIVHVSDGPIGRWHNATQAGVIRYLVYKGGYEEVYNSLFIQWSEANADSSTKQSLATTRAINLIKGVFKSPTIVSDSPYTLHVVVSTIYCADPQSYNIEILDVGKYKIDYLNKDRCEDADTSGVYTD
jgi:hypothetical protein